MKLESGATARAIAEASQMPVQEAWSICRSLENDSLVQDLSRAVSHDEAVYAILPMGESVLHKVEHGAY